ncbi:serine hydrolase domain-containing protein [Streptomyces sp. NPDC053560]|uniref:serine hydrolase domain-containing protein n=1 Tax=Streptomyces sp. NPDC053560 TaxID=3365711 RepID=UPI0037D08FD7
MSGNRPCRRGRTVGYAHRITRETVTAQHRFRVASVSKPITSTVVHLLIDRKKLALTDKVFGPGALLGTHFGTQPYSEWLRAVTLQHLLEHSAGGWENHANDPMLRRPELDRSALISWTLDHQPWYGSQAENGSTPRAWRQPLRSPRRPHGRARRVGRDPG